MSRSIFILFLFTALCFFAFEDVESAANNRQSSDSSVMTGNTADPFKAIAQDVERAGPPDARDPVSKASDQYIIWYSKYYERSWEWHLFSTKIIFAMVVIIVFFGLFVSWKQFNIDNSRNKKENAGDQTPIYDISASKDSISIKSKTIGVIILIFSGVFFYLYISVVWPMTSTTDKNALPKLASEAGSGGAN